MEDGIAKPESSMRELRSEGALVMLPPGWEAEIDGGSGEAEDGSAVLATPRIHAANFALPPQRGDFGSGAVERMKAGDVLICLLEESPAVIGTTLYSSEGMPTLTEDDFFPDGMQRPIRGQSGAQKFFYVGDRAFALYVVMGSHLSRSSLMAELNEVLGLISLP